MNKKPSHALSVNYHKIANVLLSPVKIQTVQEDSMVDSQAIWDTGATNSVLTKSLVSKLGLKPVSKKNVKGVHSAQFVNVYLVNIILPNNVRFASVPLTECNDLSADNIEILIGMDVINCGDFCVSNHDKVTCMSFRIPSIEKTDYVTQENMRKAQAERFQQTHARRKMPKKKRR